MIEETMPWKPIETAPLDGTIVDLWVVDPTYGAYRLADAWWVVGYPVYGMGFVKIGVRDGWYAHHRDYDDQSGWAFDDGEAPTHWMPLPEPPDTA